MKHSRFSSHFKKYCSWLVLRSSFHPDQGTHQVSDESLGICIFTSNCQLYCQCFKSTCAKCSTGKIFYIMIWQTILRLNGALWLAIFLVGIIDQEWGQDSWILAKFFFLHVYASRSIKHAKNKQGQYPAILNEQAWSIKDLLYGIKHQKMIFVLAGPSEKSQCGIWFILPTLGASHIIIYITDHYHGTVCFHIFSLSGEIQVEWIQRRI